MYLSYFPDPDRKDDFKSRLSSNSFLVVIPGRRVLVRLPELCQKRRLYRSSFWEPIFSCYSRVACTCRLAESWQKGRLYKSSFCEPSFSFIPGAMYLFDLPNTDRNDDFTNRPSATPVSVVIPGRHVHVRLVESWQKRRLYLSSFCKPIFLIGPVVPERCTSRTLKHFLGWGGEGVSFKSLTPVKKYYLPLLSLNLSLLVTYEVRNDDPVAGLC